MKITPVFLLSIVFTVSCSSGGGSSAPVVPPTFFGLIDVSSSYKLYKFQEGDATITVLDNTMYDAITEDYYGAHGEFVFFSSEPLGGGRQRLWIYNNSQDLSSTNPLMVEVHEPHSDEVLLGIAEGADGVYVSVSDFGVTGSKIYRYSTDTSGDLVGPTLVLDLSSSSINVSNLYIDDQLIFYAGQDTSVGSEPYVYDQGSPSSGSNPLFLGDLFTGSSGSFPDNWLRVGSHYVFRARYGTNSSNLEMMVFNPALAVSGSNPLMVEARSSSSGSTDSFLGVIDEKLYYGCRTDGNNDGELCEYDPNQPYVISTNPREITDLTGDTNGSFPSNGFVYEGKIYFVADDRSTIRDEFYVHDPGMATTTVWFDTEPGVTSLSPEFLGIYGSTMYSAMYEDNSLSDYSISSFDLAATTPTRSVVYGGLDYILEWIQSGN